jgi:hypothetical protein
MASALLHTCLGVPLPSEDTIILFLLQQSEVSLDGRGSKLHRTRHLYRFLPEGLLIGGAKPNSSVRLIGLLKT